MPRLTPSSLPRSARSRRPRRVSPPRRSTRTTTPLGLQDAFTLLTVEDGSDNPISQARLAASTAYPHAVRIVEVLRSTRDVLTQNRFQLLR